MQIHINGRPAYSRHLRKLGDREQSGINVESGLYFLQTILFFKSKICALELWSTSAFVRKGMLKWNKAAGAARYDVCRTDPLDNVQIVDAVKVTRWEDHNLLAGMPYSYHVRAYGSAGQGGASSNSYGFRVIRSVRWILATSGTRCAEQRGCGRSLGRSNAGPRRFRDPRWCRSICWRAVRRRAARGVRPAAVPGYGRAGRRA